MERAEIHKEIEDYTEKRAQSLNQTNLALIATIQKELKDHEERSVELRLQFYREMKDTITAVVKEVVNGKIDKLQKALDAHMIRVEPMISSYEDNKATGRTLGGWGKKLGALAAIILAWYTIKQFIIEHILK